MNNMKELCISFDFDGTLYDYMPPYPIVASRVLKELGYDIEPEIIRNNWSKLSSYYSSDFSHRIKQLAFFSDKEIKNTLAENAGILIRLLLPESDKNAKDPEFYKAFYETCSNGNYGPKSDVAPILTRLSEIEECYTVIVSGNKSQFIEEKLQHYDLQDTIEQIYTPDKTGIPKGDVIPLIVKDSGISENNILHLGDDPETDIFFPMKYGANSAHIEREYGCRYDPPNISKENLKYFGSFSGLEEPCLQMLQKYGLSL